jgi:hypothetical protein
VASGQFNAFSLLPGWSLHPTGRHDYG